MINGYIYSFLTREDPVKRSSRLAVHHRQVDWFVANTSIHLFIIAMNFDDADFQQVHVQAGRVTYLVKEPMKLTPARLYGFEHFYSSDADWAVMLDNDASLYSKEQHNSGAKFFEEMSSHIEDYKELDFFYPLNPAIQGFSPLYKKDPLLYRDNHVFSRGVAMKGSMFFMRNFRKAGEREMWPDVSFDFMEDNRLAIGAVEMGKTVHMCANIVLKEEGLSSSSYATDNEERKAQMVEPCKRLVQLFGHRGLELHPSKAHNLSYKRFYEQCWTAPKQTIVPKRASVDPLFSW